MQCTATRLVAGPRVVPAGARLRLAFIDAPWSRGSALRPQASGLRWAALPRQASSEAQRPQPANSSRIPADPPSSRLSRRGHPGFWWTSFRAPEPVLREPCGTIAYACFWPRFVPSALHVLHATHLVPSMPDLLAGFAVRTPELNMVMRQHSTGWPGRRASV
jgi:hypothetical protein